MKRRSQHQIARHYRRLTFERCEPRLTLSGDGGFIQFDVGDYLSASGSDFLLTAKGVDSVSGLIAAPQSNGTATAGLALSISRDHFLWTVNSHLDSDYRIFSGTSQQFVPRNLLSDQELQDLIDRHILVDSPLGIQIPEPAFEPASLLPNLGPPESGKAPAFEPALAVMEVEAPLADFSREASAGVTVDYPTLPPITALEALLLARKDAELHDPAGELDGLAEGGAIEVDQAVAAAQRAYEFELFAEVAAQLDGQHGLAQADSPAAKPLVGELARAVVFEVVGQEPTVDETAHREGAHGPSAAIPADDPTAALAIKSERDESASSRALAFAEWPLYFSAALGGVLATRRRRSHADTTQHPPRRRSGQPLAR